MTHKEQIIQALHLSLDDYSQAVEEMGYQWIVWYFGNDPDAIQVLSTCKPFWQWWVNQWEIRDEEYIRVTGIDLIGEPLEGIYWEAAYKEWLDLHKAKNISARPNHLVRAAFARALRLQEAELENLLKH